MKRFWILVSFFVVFLSCNSNGIEKPDNLIDEDTMVAILYDISVLDAIKNQNPMPGTQYPTTSEMLKSKYKTDSLTFANSSKYYAADYKKYRKMYDEVKKRLEEQVSKIGGTPVPPPDNQGIVK